MATQTLHPLVDRVLQMVGRQRGPGVRDSQLLERFVDLKDETAFETIIWRHGPMVLGFCRRILRDRHEAEDAFQATFLVLCRKAASISQRESLGSWLFKVAYRVALRARDRVGPRPGDVERVDPPAPEAVCDLIWRDLRAVLDEQLDLLPEKYRAPLVLHYLEGKTVEQVARELGWPPGTVAGRLNRAKQLLRKRLVRQGMTLSATALGTALAPGMATAQPPAGLVASTLQAATLCAAGKTGAVSASVVALTQGVLRAMYFRTMKVAATLAAAFCLLGVASGLLVYRALAEQDKPGAVASAAAPQPAEVQKDGNGDPLPGGAVARMGTARLRHFGLSGPYYWHSDSVAFLPGGKTLFSAGRWSFRFWDTASGQMTGGINLEKEDLPQRSMLAACALAPDGKTVAATMRYEGTIRLLDAATGKEIRRFVGHARGVGTRSVTRIDFSRDGKMLASVGVDGTLRLWDVATGKQIRQLAPFDPVKRIPVGLLGDTNPFVKFSPDGRMLVSKDGGNLRLWEVATGKEIRQLQKAGGGPQLGGPPASRAPVEAAFSPDSKVIAVGNLGAILGPAKTPSSIMLWETLTGKEIREIVLPTDKITFPPGIGVREQAHAPTVRALTFAPDGKTLAAAFDTAQMTWECRGICVYEWATGKKVTQIDGHKAIVCSLAYSPDGKLLASAAVDSTIRLWDPVTGKQIHKGDGNATWVQAVAYSPDGKMIATGSGQAGDNAIHLWNTATGKLIHRIPGAPPHTRPGIRSIDVEKVWSLAFSPDSKTLASGNGDASIYLWATDSGKQIQRLDGHKHWVRSVAFSPDGKILASAGQDKSVRLWDSATGKPIRQLDGHDHGVRNVAFSRDGKMLASISEHTLLLWEPTTGKAIPHKVGKLSFDGLSMALSPDGKTVAIGGGHGSFETHLVELATGKELGRCPHKDAPWCLAFSPDGKLMASAGHDHKLFLMDVATGKLVIGFDAQQGPLFCVAFSPDSKAFVTGGEDTTALVWDVDRLRRDGGPAAPGDKVPPKKTNQEPAKPGDRNPPEQTDQQPARPGDQNLHRQSNEEPAKKSTPATIQGPSDRSPETSTRPTDKGSDDPITKELERLWIALGSDDAGKAYEAIAALTATPERAVPFLQERLRLPAPADPPRLGRWIADLDSDDFSVREKATKGLEKLAETAEPALRQALAKKPSKEASRRLEQLLEKFSTPSSRIVQQLRAVQALEYAGTPEARKVLAMLARGTEESRLTREARASLQRLLKQ